MEQKVNYITHLNAVFENIVNDKRLSPFHVSLYFTLFQYWNISKFRNPISINREEMMQASKIGSANTYTKCLKELHQWKYLNYLPSYSPLIGSKIHLYIFNKTNNTTNNNGTNISTYKSNNKTAKKAVIPSINSLNKTNKLNSKNSYEHKRTKNNRKPSDSSGEGIKKEKSSGKKERRNFPSDEVKNPTFNQVKTYFTSKQWPPIEAQKFFNYFQSNGWLVGGKTPMKNWQAAARNWMLNSEKFNNGKTKTGRAGRLNATTGKNYNEPL